MLQEAAVNELAFTGDVGVESVELPGTLHGDPADRIIVATARLAGMPLATRDKRLLDDGRAGHVEAVAV